MANLKNPAGLSNVRRLLMAILILTIARGLSTNAQEPLPKNKKKASVTLNQKADGFRGIWYMNQPLKSEYRYKYSGGLGTYCAKHRPFAIFRPDVKRTYFCYGGAKKDDDQALVHMVSYFDHQSGMLARPTLILDKKTHDAHDNPVISMDAEGFIWIFSTSHGRSRPSYIHRSKRPHDIEEFQRIEATRETSGGKKLIENFSYFQVWNQPRDGFRAFFTRYRYPADRTICFMKSADGKNWSHWQRLAAIEKGHYQISGSGKQRVGTMFNMHPDPKGLNWRTNLYYIESRDQGDSWCTVDGKTISVPLTDRDNSALVRNFAMEKKLVYLKDLQYDHRDRPVLLYLVSQGFEAGPQHPARQWRITRWDGANWKDQAVTTSDSNYDLGELWLEKPDQWWLIAPTEVGPQPFNPGGEVAVWQSKDQGQTWNIKKWLTLASRKNHTYVRIVRDAHPDFIAIWADGHGRQPSGSSLYFTNRAGQVFRMPQDIEKGKKFTFPELIGN